MGLGSNIAKGVTKITIMYPMDRWISVFGFVERATAPIRTSIARSLGINKEPANWEVLFEKVNNQVEQSSDPQEKMNIIDQTMKSEVFEYSPGFRYLTYTLGAKVKRGLEGAS